MFTIPAMNSLLATVRSANAEQIIAWVIVLGCLGAAAYCAFHRALWAMAGLLLVAIVAAALLLG